MRPLIDRVFEDQLNEPRPRDRALSLVTLCVGGMVLARNVDDPALADSFRRAARRGTEDRGLGLNPDPDVIPMRVCQF